MTTSPSRCYIRKTKNGNWTWVGQIACKCVMAVAEKETIHDNDLDKFITEGELSRKEVSAIRAFDNRMGKKEDKDVIEKIAKRYKVELLVRTY